MQAYSYDFRNLLPIHPMVEVNLPINSALILFDGTTSYVAWARFVKQKKEVRVFQERESPEELVKKFFKIGDNSFGEIMKFPNSEGYFIDTLPWFKEMSLSAVKIRDIIQQMMS